MKSTSPIFRALEFYGTRVNHPGQWLIHEKLRNLFRVRVDEDLEVTRDRLKWILNPSDFMQSGVFWLGEQDRWDIYHIKRRLKPGAVIFDVGANFGYYSLVLARALEGECGVHSFEPNARMFERLLRHIALNNLGDAIAAHRLALSDREGSGRMVERVGNSGAASVEVSGEGGDVVLKTLDSFCREHRINRIDFIKIDIEGFEERFLNGAARTLPRLKPMLLIELNPSTLQRENSSAERVTGMLREFGYQIFTSRKGEMRPLNRLPQGFEIVNAFCFPTGREALEV